MTNYNLIDDLAKHTKKKVCIFGAGFLGKTFCYKLVKTAGFNIDYYCDNSIKLHGQTINGISIISPRDLHEMRKEVLVFIGGADVMQREVYKQLVELGISENCIINADYKLMQEIIEEIEAKNDKKAYERWKEFIDDELYLKWRYESYTGKKLKLDNTRSFNEKLQWLKLYDRRLEYSMLVDKYSVKEYVSKKYGDQYIIPTIGVWDHFDDIPWDGLPDQFVMKCTHDSGSVVICKDKSVVDRGEVREKMESSLSRNYYYQGREWSYKNVNPRIIVEKYITDESRTELKDYKIFCFSGKARMIQVDYDRFCGHKRNLYDTNWHYLDAVIKYPTDKDHIIDKPDMLEKMLELAEKMSLDFPHVRIDFYSIKDRIFFGEYTFYHGSGYEKFIPEELGTMMGNWIELPEKSCQ